jgi:squid-like protein/heterogeneous nuclear ribonucleoprotein A1/A3
MNAVHRRWVMGAFGAVALAMAQSCAVEGVGVDGTVGVGYDAGYYGGGYYEPYGYDYGGWGGGYRVGPGRGGDRRGGGSRGYRAAPSSRSAPSIPNGSRGGGGRR